MLVAVVPMPDLEMGERVCAYVQPRPGARLHFNDILSFLKDRKASVLHFPERIEFIDTMPFTKAEKIDKMALVKDIGEKNKRQMMRVMQLPSLGPSWIEVVSPPKP